MTDMPDPMAMFRDVMAQWEKLANDYGGQMLQRPEAAAMMHKATTAGLQVQNAVQDAMTKVLAAANMPSCADIEAIGQRLSAIEATLARIEAGSTASSPAGSRPTRGRKPD